MYFRAIMYFHESHPRVLRAAIAVGLLSLLGSGPSMADQSSAAGSAASRTILSGSSAPEAAGGELSLGAALARAVKGSPELASYSWEIRAREASALQAGLRPNPTLSVEVENIGGSGAKRGVESAETTLLLSQLIELGGKRRKRRSVGTLEAESAEWEYEVARLAVIADTTAAFVDALARQGAIHQADEQIRLAEDVLQAVRSQVRAGAVSSAEVPRAEVEVTNQRIERKLAGRALQAALVRLATAWGASEPGFQTLVGDLDDVPPIPPEAELVGRMAATPELARRQAEVTKRRAEIELQDARRIPDLNLGLGPRHFNDTSDWALVVGVQMPIPVFDRNQGARRASRDQLARSREEKRSMELRLRRALALSYQGLASAYDEVTALRDEAIPMAERAYAETKRAQRQGALRFTEVLDAQRSLFALRTRLVGALASYHVSRARAEALIGGPLVAEKDS
jgi:cobalt-zinc-cadmium efflux system outer membrane protein